MYLRVLVTRPKAHTTLHALQKMGCSTLHVPCLRIVPVPSETKQGQLNQTFIMNLDVYNHVVMVSTNAVHCFLPVAKAYWSHWPAEQTWWGTGPATKMALHKASILKVQRPLMADTSEALLGELLPLLTGTEKVLIVRGVGGRETLAKGLREQNIKVDYVQCYWRLPSVIDDQMRRAAIAFAPQVVLLQSGDTLRYFHTQLASTWRQSNHFFQLLVPSWRVADMARHMGYARVLVSKGASDQAICDTLSQL